MKSFIQLLCTTVLLITPLNSPYLARANAPDKPLISPRSPIYRIVQKTKDGKKVNLDQNEKTYYQISVIGLDLVIDSSDPLWSSLSAGNISEIYLEAETITIKNVNRWPGANLSITTQNLIIDSEGEINLTPLEKDTEIIPQVKTNGKDGIPGADFKLSVQNIVFEDSNPHQIFYVDGGRGQKAGAGIDGHKGEDVVPVPDDVFRAFPPNEQVRYRGHLIGAENLEIKKTDMCHGNMPGGRHWKFPCGSHTRNYTGQGVTNHWPQNGGDAQPAGFPGAGGAGGTASILTPLTNISWQEIVSLKAGQIGKPGAETKGGAAGEPRTAIILRARNSGGEYGHYEDEVHYTQPGRDATAPQFPDHTNPDGVLVVQKAEQISPKSLSYIEAKLAYIRDLFLGEYYDKAYSEIESALNTVKANPSVFESTLTLSRLNLLKSHLILGKTYFGEARQAVPFYSMDVDLQKLSAEIDMHLNQRTYLHAVLEQQKANTLNSDTLTQAISVAQKTTNNAIDEIEKINQKRLGVASALKDLEAQKASYEKQAVQILDHLTVAARSHEAFHKELERNKTLFMESLAALSTFLGGPSAVVVFKTLSEVPTSGSLDDYLAWIAKLKGAIDAQRAQGPSPYQELLKWFDETNFQAIFNNVEFRAYLDQLKKSFVNLTFEEKLKLLQQFNKQKNKVNYDIEKIIRFIEESKVKQADVDKAVELLKARDGQYGEIIKRIEILKGRIQSCQNDLSSYINATLIWEKAIEDSSMIILAGTKDLFKNAQSRDEILTDVLIRQGHESEDRLLLTYYKLLSALRYSTLSEQVSLLNLYYLKNSIERVLIEEPLEKRQTAIQSLYLHALQEAKHKLFTSISTTQVVRKNVTEYKLSPYELQRLNKFGYLRLNLDNRFYHNQGEQKKKLMISKVEIVNPSYASNGNHAYHGRSMVEFVFQLDPKGVLFDSSGKSWEFDYSNLGSLNRWVAQSNFEDSTENHHQVIIDRDYYKNAIGALLGQTQPGLEYSNLFSQHAAYASATLCMTKYGEIRTQKLQNLSLRIHFDYLD